MSLTDLFAENKSTAYCVHCRQEPESTTITFMRCSRCRVVHYCSRECQKLNFSLHKTWCKQIDKCRKHMSSIEEEEEANNNNNKSDAAAATTSKNLQYLLARTIFELAYRSTDTIDRGKTIYQSALLEYYKLMRMDPFYIGACESVVLLLALLEYDDLCVGLIQFMLHPPGYESDGDGKNGIMMAMTREEAIRNYTTTLNCSSSPQGEDSDVWIYQAPPGRENIHFSFDECNTIRDKIPKQWCPNLFLVPLLLIKMRQRSRTMVAWGTATTNTQQSGSSSSDDNESLLREEIVNLGRQVEYEAQFLLPVLHSLFPDSRQRWGPEEVCSLFAAVNYPELLLQGSDETNNIDDDDDDDEMPHYQPNIWQQHCDTFWMILKDCYAFTPGILDVVEETIEAMQLMGKPAIPEDPEDTPTTAEYMDFIHYMAEKQKTSQENNFNDNY